MSVRLVHRAARTTPAAPGPADQDIERPPTLPEGQGGFGQLIMLVPLLGAGASMTVMMLFRGSSFAAIGALMMVAVLISSVVMLVSQRGKATRARVRKREAYLSYLERARTAMRSADARTEEVAWHSDPACTGLLAVVRDQDRLWERRRGDGDFLQARLGTGPMPVRRFDEQGGDDALTETDEFLARELEVIQRRFTTLDDLPVRVPLERAGHVSIVGGPGFRTAAVRNLLCQAATFVSPEDLHLAAAIAPERRRRWDWLAWLPHLADQRQATAEGPQRRLAPDVVTLDRMIREDLRRRRARTAESRRDLTGRKGATPHATMVIVVDVDDPTEQPLLLGDVEHGPADLGLTVLHLVDDQRQEPEDVRMRIVQAGEAGEAVLERLERRDSVPVRQEVQLDRFSAAEAETLCRHLAGLRLSADSLEHDASSQALQVTGLLGVDDVERIDLDALWGPRPRTSFLRVPIGTDDQGDPVMLDLKESAQFGMGPHGICVGATGSGKSELLRTLVLALLTSHGPDDLAMVLVDYKGGATFAPFATAPQVSGVITNLSDDSTLVERVYASLAGEVQRRQQMLKDAGNLSDISAYRRLRREQAGAGASLPPMPHLLVIIDEFGELLTARPDFIELFLSIGRIGRSIGVHLLLSSQRIEGGKLRGLDTYLSYRIGLRTLSEAESRTILDTTDAYALPALPGYGYLKVDTTTYTRFRAGYVSGAIPDDTEVEVDEAPVLRPLADYPAIPVEDEPGVETTEADALDEEPTGPTVLATVIDQIARRPASGSPVWLPPLPEQLTLDQAAGPAVATAEGVRVPSAGPLRVPIGRLDDPRGQTQGPWELDLAAAGGHVLVIGAPRSGKTTVLRTLAASLAVTHRVEEAVVYAIDLLGSNLMALDGLPNVAGVGLRSDPEVVRRTVEEVHALLERREDLFQRLRVDSLPAARAAAGPASGEMLADVVLLVDGYGLVEDFAGLEETMLTLVRRGGGLGIHVVATATRWNDVRMQQQTFFGTKVELRLADAGDSAVDSKLRATLRDAPAGRALLPARLFAQVALPRVDGRADRGSAAEGLAELVARVGESATSTAPRVRLLPSVVASGDLAPAGRAGMVPLGLHEATLETVTIDLEGTDRHVLALGDSQTGRTSLLRHVVQTLIAQHTPEEIVFAVIDPRRVLRGEVPDEYLGGYASSAPLAERLVAAVLPELQKRVPMQVGDEPEETHLPKIVVVVDDYEVVTAGSSSPLAPLVPFISMAAEVNLHVLLTRRTSGASRGVYESAFMALRDSGSVGLMYSGDRTEGQLLGSERPQRLPTGRARLLRTGEPMITVQVGHREQTDDALGGRGFGDG